MGRLTILCSRARTPKLDLRGDEEGAEYNPTVKEGWVFLLRPKLMEHSEHKFAGRNNPAEAG